MQNAHESKHGQQKVDLNDEKLRRYFKYWLEVISDLIEKELVGISKNYLGFL